LIKKSCFLIREFQLITKQCFLDWGVPVLWIGGSPSPQPPGPQNEPSRPNLDPNLAKMLTQSIYLAQMWLTLTEDKHPWCQKVTKRGWTGHAVFRAARSTAFRSQKCVAKAPKVGAEAPNGCQIPGKSSQSEPPERQIGPKGRNSELQESYKSRFEI